jgi:hypothetical protein
MDGGLADFSIAFRIVSPSVFPALPESPQGEYSVGFLAKEASTDRSSFVANGSLSQSGSHQLN